MRHRKRQRRLEFRLQDRTITLEGAKADEVRRVLIEQRARFRAKFGRDPGLDDPIFFDPDQDTPQPWNEESYRKHWEATLDKAQALGLDPAKVYAAKKVGVIATTENWDLMRPEDREAWNAAVEEYEREHGK